ncbi:MAG: hypothetical protein ACFHHU_16265 [Porticoccaceae bacterium]|uniref:hypothetical protein n=1 Tax=Thalassospira sp. TaxID=1912094 RepID=UPI003A8BBD3B
MEYATRAINLIAEKARDFEENGPFDPDFTVPHSTMLTTTIGGGTATNGCLLQILSAEKLITASYCRNYSPR